MAYFHCYRSHRFNSAAQKTVDQANVIIDEMRAQGYTLTLRQLYYQFVARDLMPNQDREYKRLGRIVTRAREGGVMDWYAIEDRGRSATGPYSEEDPANVVNGIELGLSFDQWARQDHYLEVWVEKSALEGVISRPCNRCDITYMACKGYLSASEAWRAGLRFQAAAADGKIPILIHLADHDPSGLHMTEDNRNRVRLFAEDHSIEVKRIALTMEQVEEYGPPPNPAKQTDSRYKSYENAYGKDSWELDALEPSMLDRLIIDTIDEYRDIGIWNRVLEEQAAARVPLATLHEHWDTLNTLTENWDTVDVVKWKWDRVVEFLEEEGLV